MAHSASRTAYIVGATGLVGGQLVRELAESKLYGSVVSLARRRVDKFPPSVTQKIVDFSRLEEELGSATGSDIFCALGTTIKVAGSQEAFRRVDFEYPLRLAEWGVKRGFERFFFVSSLGADARSRVFYSRTKGELEEALQKMPWKALHIYRPSLLLGERAEKRAGEQFAKVAMGLGSVFLQGPLKKYRPIEGQTVARAMVASARDLALSGVRVYESDEIARCVSSQGGQT